MATVYKLTDEHGRTQGSTQWGPNVTHDVSDKGECKPCTSSALHAYTDPLLAAAFNTIHADIQKPRLWRAEMDILGTDGQKVWGQRLTTVEEMSLPVISAPARVLWAILLAYPMASPAWRMWANAWIDGTDRAADVAARAEYAAADVADAADAAARAADAAAHAAYAAGRATDAADAAAVLRLAIAMEATRKDT